MGNGDDEEDQLRLDSLPSAEPETFLFAAGADSERTGSWEAKDFCSGCFAHSSIAGNLTLPLKGCALIGSSDQLKGSELGRRIDSFTTVIRVNRMPSKEYFDDYGKRTDVFFTGAVAKSKPTFNESGQFYATFGGDVHLCKFNQSKCPFRTVVLKGADKAECGLNFSERYPPDHPGWVPPNSTFPILRQSDQINTLAYQLLGWQPKRTDLTPRPTNGFQAFVWALAACDDLHIFGYGGSGTVDKHGISNVHNLTLEHTVMTNLIRGKLNKEIWRDVPECAPCLLEKFRRVKR